MTSKNEAAKPRLSMQLQPKRTDSLADLFYAAISQASILPPCGSELDMLHCSGS